MFKGLPLNKTSKQMEIKWLKSAFEPFFFPTL